MLVPPNDTAWAMFCPLLPIVLACNDHKRKSKTFIYCWQHLSLALVVPCNPGRELVALVDALDALQIVHNIIIQK
uniref:Putative secreted protein n=1 Tax=Anopheles triannulatus TaxID=58253 RepID=A0A2M4B0D4_9DIPT